MKKLTTLKEGLRPVARLGLLAIVLVTFNLWSAPAARAETLLLATTTLVSGSSAASFSFNAPSAGTVTAQISSLPWPVPLSALSFSATTATDTLSSWSSLDSSTMQAASADAGATSHVETFEVGSGTYFAHVMATAGGTLDLGLYSLMLTFTPSAVPLPAAAGMLLIGLLVLFALRRTLPTAGSRNESVMSAA
jgi:hypothetical protein